MTRQTAIEFLATHLNDADGSHVIPSTTPLEFGRVRHTTFLRIESNYHVDIGPHGSYLSYYIPTSRFGQTNREILEGLDLRIRWLPEHNNQDLKAQLVYHNIYYTVDGLEKLPGLKWPGYFWTSIHSDAGWGPFLPPDSLVMKEYWRLKEMEQCEVTIKAAAGAAVKLRSLEKQGSFMPTPEDA